MKQNCIAILGRQDKPTDAVEEYCRYLGEALLAENFELIIERVAWPESGWTRAASALRHRARGWAGAWVLVQYTALAWSARGFPVRFTRVLKTLKVAGARIAVVFHDVEPYSGTRVIDGLRRRSQLRAMLEALRLSDAAVFTIPMENVSWIKRHPGKGHFIPVGANLPTSSDANSRKGISMGENLSVAVFGITGGEAGRKEIERATGKRRGAYSHRFRRSTFCARTHFHAARQRDRRDCLRLAGDRVRGSGNGGADHRGGVGAFFTAEEGRPGKRIGARFGGRALSCFAGTAKLGGPAAIFLLACDCCALRGIHAERELACAAWQAASGTQGITGTKLRSRLPFFSQQAWSRRRARRSNLRQRPPPKR